MSNKNIKSDTSLTQPFNGYVVGIGASAGGLEALEKFFSTCPYKSGLAFVVIQHLSPDYKSMMGDLLSRYTKIPIHIVEDGMPLAANSVYLIPSGTLMRVVDGHFELTDKAPHVLTLPVDIFFKSLAVNYQEKAVGVILSGTGSDGTRGAYAINEAGGFLLSQEPGTSKFNGMPNSVIDTGLVDEILPAEALASRIIAYTKDPIKKEPIEIVTVDSERPSDHESAMEMIYQLLLESSGVDFQEYKIATVSRRIERRMQVKITPMIQDYALLLAQDKGELANLKRELFIPVTSFFRDTQAFEDLASSAVEDIVSRATSGEGIRVWCAGVATGEEVYSITMLFMEAFEKNKRWPNLKIFATDANPLILEVAAAGQYPESIAAELTSERLERFFTKNNGQFTIKPELRQSVVFAKHNLITDPPFTRMDLVSCRNTLIYFDSEAQLKAMHRLQYATKMESYLFLGSSESLSANLKSFSIIHQKSKIFKRNVNNILFPIDGTKSDAALYSPLGFKPPKVSVKAKVFNDISIIEESTRNLIAAYSPPAILVNEKHEAVHLFGKVQPYFSLRDGAVNMQITRILPNALVSIVAALLYKAIKEQIVLFSDYITVTLNDASSKQVRVCIRPIENDGDERFALILFEEAESKIAPNYAQIDINAEISGRIDILQQELSATRESLQATIEELETSNEELQATNEELMASNEELQSSNEELQSVNEEMNTVNAEFQEKVMNLNQANADLETMGKAVGVATIFVDKDLKLTRFTPDALDIFKLIDTDIGRPLDDIRHKLNEDNVHESFAKTIRTGLSFETEVSSKDGRVYLLRILPYHAPNSKTVGAVATFTDVSVIHDKDRLQSVLDALPEHIAVLSNDGTICLLNESWRRFARANGDPDLLKSGVGSNYLEACNSETMDDEDSRSKSYFGIKAVLEGSQASFSLSYPCHSPNEKRWFVVNATPISGRFEYSVVVSHSNITASYTQDKGLSKDNIDD